MDNPETKLILQKLEQIYSVTSALGLEVSTTSTKQTPTNVYQVIEVLRSGWINDLTGYFQNHRTLSQYTKLDDEYKVQDLLYCLLRPFISDLQFENPQSKPVGALSYPRVDFSSERLELLLEIKHVSSKKKARQVESEIAEDISKYGRSRRFKYLIFYIYCFGYSFPNKSEFERGLTGTHSISKNSFDTFCVVS